MRSDKEFKSKVMRAAKKIHNAGGCDAADEFLDYSACIIQYQYKQKSIKIYVLEGRSNEKITLFI